MSGILARAMIGVMASDSPELVGPQMACTLAWLIISWVAFTALVGIALRVANDDLELAALDAAGGIDGVGREIDAAIEADGRRRARPGHRGKPADPDRFRLGDGGLWK